MEKLFAGIDLGTSGCRIVVVDNARAVKVDEQISYSDDLKQTPGLWWNSVKNLLVALPVSIKENLQSIAIDGTSGTLLLSDKQGKPTSSVLMYHDMRATDEAKLIKQVLPVDSGAQGVASSLARLLWLLKHEANQDHYYALHQADYILGKLTNNFGFSDENNCLKMGYDAVKRCWPDGLKKLGFSMSLLPKVVAAGTALGKIDHKIADQLGLPKSLQLVSGTTDSIAAFIASGASRMGEAVTSLGSTLVVKLVSNKPVYAPEYGVYSHRLGDYWLVGGASNSGGKVLRHYFSTKQLNAMTKLLKLEQPTGLDYYPLIEPGERFPVADTNKHADLSPRPESDVVFFQGMLEGIASIEATAYQKLAELGAPALTSVRSVGGGSYNAAWTHIRKNSLAVDMVTPKHTEAAYGSALLAQQGYRNKD